MKEKKIPGPLWIIFIVLAYILFQKSQSKPLESLSARTTEKRLVYKNPNVNMGELGTIEANQTILLNGRYGDTWVTFTFKGQPAWIQDFFLDIDNNENMRLPEVEAVSQSPVQISQESRVLNYFQNIINNPKYDPKVSVIHKYVDDLEVTLSGNVLSFYVSKPIDDIVDYYALSIDLIFGSALLSDAGGESDWDLTLIEIVNPSNYENPERMFVSGKGVIESISNAPSKIYDLLEFDFGSSNFAITGISENYLGSNSTSQDLSPTLEEGCPQGCTFHKDGCDIKGNVSFDTEEKIYHVLGQEYYSETTINSQYGERWFCTENEAIANGWRKAYR